MKYKILAYLFVVFLLFPVFWLIPIRSVDGVKKIYFDQSVDLQRQDFVKLSAHKRLSNKPLPRFSVAQKLTTEADLLKQATTTFQVYYVDLEKSEVQSRNIPNDSIKKRSLLTDKMISKNQQLALPKGEGYISFSENSPYYIWYPKIGRQVFIFDSRGEFLWAKNESRYLRAFHDGRYTIAVAGDHSRILFTNADLSTLVDIEGVNMVGYQLADINLNAESSQFHACLGFLNGDVVMTDLISKKSYRYSSKNILKSIACDLTSGIFYAQVNQVVGHPAQLTSEDILIGGVVNKVQTEKKEIEAEAKLFPALPLNYSEPFALPMAVNERGVLFLLRGDNQKQLFFAIYHQGKKLIEQNLHPFIENKNLGDFRIITRGETFLIYNSSQFFIGNADGIYYVSPFFAGGDSSRKEKLEKAFFAGEYLILHRNKEILLLTGF